jgi:DNA-binding IclR family transcriptional regulator
VLFAYQGDEIRERWLGFLAEDDRDFDRKKFVKLANQIRARGYASAPSQVVDGVVDYSAAVLQHDHAICALTVPFIARRASKVTADNAVRQLCRAAADISNSLQYGISRKG